MAFSPDCAQHTAGETVTVSVGSEQLFDSETVLVVGLRVGQLQIFSNHFEFIAVLVDHLKREDSCSAYVKYSWNVIFYHIALGSFPLLSRRRGRQLNESTLRRAGVCNPWPAGQKWPESWSYVAREKIHIFKQALRFLKGITDLLWAASELFNRQSLNHAVVACGPIWLCAFGPAPLHGSTPLA